MITTLPNLLRDQNLRDKHYFRFDVMAARLLPIRSHRDLQALASHPEWAGRALVLGGGSNLLIAKPMLSDWVLSLQNTGFVLVKEDASSVILDVQAGMSWDALVRQCVARSWVGLEALSMIPGTVGGAVVQNIGAYGATLADRVVSCQVWSFANHACETWDCDACAFGYRSSAFKQSPGHVVLSVRLRLAKDGVSSLRYEALQRLAKEAGVIRPTPSQVREWVMAMRKQKLPDPKHYPNAGSFFKNPVVTIAHHEMLLRTHPSLVAWPDPGGMKLAAGQLIEACGLKGYRMGGVCVSPKHALVLVHDGEAMPTDLLALMNHVQACVKATYGVQLVPEVQIIG